MNFLQSLFLGIVQGLTEFLPVSSSGHLAIFQNIFHIDTGSSMLYDVLLHLATLLVVFIYFRKEIWQLIRTFFSMIGDLFHNFRARFFPGKDKDEIVLRRIITSNYRKFVLLIIVSTIPTGIMGYLGKKLIADASETLLVPGICLMITAVLLFLSDRVTDNYKIPKDVSWREAVIIGIAQGFATLPGLSRSGTTISTCLFLKLDRKFAVKYSFILSIPAILGATLLELKDIGAEKITASVGVTYAVGMVAAAVVGYLCIRFMMKVVSHRKFRYFAYYCFAAGILAVVGHFVLIR